MDTKLLLIAISLVIMNGQAMNISNQINSVLDNDILQNHRIQYLFKITNCNIDFNLFN